MQTVTINEQRKIQNRTVNDLAWVAQEALLRIQAGTSSQTIIPKLAFAAKEALLRLRPLTGGDYRVAIDDLERLIHSHQARGTAWDETIGQMERILQETQNAPMAPREMRVVIHA
jgi:hypothetical protein